MNIVITGAASGLGLALARQYATKDNQLLLLDRDFDGLTKVAIELSPRVAQVLIQQADVSQWQDWVEARDKLEEKWGHIDLLVNNAGVGGSVSLIDGVKEQDWSWTLDINLKGPFLGCKAFTPLFKGQRSGHIVNIASAAGVMNPPQMSAYNVSKAGVIALSETLLYEVSPFDVGVTVVCPAFFETGLHHSIRSTSDEVKARIGNMMANNALQAGDVAAQIQNAVHNNHFMLFTHGNERRLWRLKRWLPGVFMRKMKQRCERLLSRIHKDQKVDA